MNSKEIVSRICREKTGLSGFYCGGLDSDLCALGAVFADHIRVLIRQLLFTQPPIDLF